MRVICGVFLFVGLGLLAGGVLAIQHTRHFVRNAVLAQGVVTENVRPGGGRAVYYPRVRFRTAGGRQISFLSSGGSNPPAYRVGESVTVLYDPQDPYNVSIRSFWNVWVLPFILCSLGVFFFLVGGALMAVAVVTARRNTWLRQNGRRIQAQFTGVESSANRSVRGSTLYRIVCQWLDPANQVHVFKSADIPFDPTSYVPGKTLEVLIDPNNPKRYVVETSFLPKLA
ncbi:MAG TPA: DUF3592 domain-containing protein [Bryobacteraceae bacterium]|nr:DUF3592 domain-containing protein [Bryobacteraceae bacterium]